MRPVTVVPASLPEASGCSADEVLTPAALAELSDAEVTDRLTTWAGRVAAGEAWLLGYLGEFDQRKAWAEVGVLSCAHWLSWRLGLGAKAAFERVRVARALRDLPATCAAFAAGRLSFTQVRAITRVASPADEQTYVEVARHATGGQLEKLARGVRRARRLAAEAKDGAPDGPAKPRMTISYDADGSLKVTLRVPAEQGAVVLAALDAVQADLDADAVQADAAELHPTASGESSPEESSAGTQPTHGARSSAEESPARRRATPAEGLLRLCQAYLQHRGHTHPDRARRDRARLTVQVDPLSGWARLPDGELLPPHVATQAKLSLPAGVPLRPLRPSDLTRHDAGRTRREPDQALRDLLVTVDGERCRYPACTRRRKLHAHHLRPWSEGGATDLANLLLLCPRHHTLVHADHFQLALDPTTRTVTITSKAGTTIPHRPPLPWRPTAELDPSAAIGPHTLPPTVHDRLDLHYAVSVLLQHAA